MPATGLFREAGEHLVKAAGSVWNATKAGTKGAHEALKSADAAFAKRIVDDKGVWGAVKGIAKERPFTSTLATVGAIGGLAYGGYKVVGHFTGREAERQATRDQNRSH